ncbi:LysR substrate-binding domain-containing protein [Streptomyces tirandamycinicus]|uniref:LysR substrate-binding domain-containing protein n=1 Tax=Streptomyces tirandamycinicus TaxID=2174846 RepID=UPI00226FD56B|nr:LysR substrate-binding domain-containing protein [Streptomyces tirandamycinicus]MCY0982047.1 LysR substrate-binding domain-containing protein [Streptomyces tirandamycinicus]
MTGSEASPSFRLAYVPGVTPGKWVRIWQERLPDVPLDLLAVPSAEAPGLLRDGGADAGVVRLPVDRTFFSAIPLYTETTVVVVPKDHAVAAVDEVSLEDLAEDVVFHPLDDTLEWHRLPGRPAIERPATTADAIELVAAGVGVLVVPQSLARLHHRRDLTYRTVTDAPQSSVALSWPEDRTTDLVDDFIGIVRGRTVNSTRGRRPSPAEQPKHQSTNQSKDQPKDTARRSGRSAQGAAGGKSAAGGRRGAATGRGGASAGRRGAKPGRPRRRS